MKKMIILGAAAVLMLSACASAGDLDAPGNNGEGAVADESGAATSGLGDSGDALPPGGETPPAADDRDSVVPGGEMPPGVEVATADLAAHLGVSIDVIDWVSYEEVVWPDGSLGCPQPGMAYTTALVNGSRIILAVAGIEYAYHSGGSRGPFRCIRVSVSREG